MIFINLLPSESRVKEAKKLNLPYRQMGVLVFIIFLVLALYNLFLFVRVRGEYRKLVRQWQSMAERSNEAEALEKDLGAAILSEVDFYDSFVDPTLEAARVLNAVGALLPGTAWLSELKLQRRKKEVELILIGSSRSGLRGSLLIEIQNFVNELKGKIDPFIGPVTQMNPDVKKQIKVALTTSSKKGEAGWEITEFTATFKTEGFDLS